MKYKKIENVFTTVKNILFEGCFILRDLGYEMEGVSMPINEDEYIQFPVTSIDFKKQISLPSVPSGFKLHNDIENQCSSLMYLFPIGIFTDEIAELFFTASLNFYKWAHALLEKKE